MADTKKKKKVYIISGYGWDKVDIQMELRQEGFDNDNYFDSRQALSVKELNADLSDEIWCFGECNDKYIYQYCVDKGYDIWIMSE